MVHYLFIKVRTHVQLSFLPEILPITKRLWTAVESNLSEVEQFAVRLSCVTTGPLRERDTRRLPPTNSLISHIAANIPQATGNEYDMGYHRSIRKGKKRGWDSRSRDANPCTLHAAIFNHVIWLVRNQANASGGLILVLFWAGYFPFQCWQCGEQPHLRCRYQRTSKYWQFLIVSFLSQSKRVCHSASTA